MSAVWQDLRRHTQARIGLGRSGDAQPTRSVLEFRAAHALARDAVRQPFDVGCLAQQVAEVGLGEPVAVTSRASSRQEYLRRPDLGRLPNDLSEIPCTAAEVGFVLCDGLSPRALTEHGVALLRALADVVGAHRTIAAPVIATGARVALGDHIGQAMGVQTVVVLIGERPGLSVASSLGLYLTHLPRPGRSDAERNCVSNVHPPDGLGYLDAARVIDALITGARTLGRSGVDLKAVSVGALEGSLPRGGPSFGSPSSSLAEPPGSTTLDQHVVS
ncbi:ethanolamine ammonia-lyase subunit EutC [Mycolicibacter heraklionensis]|uniref:Ethanolamine ammonia-lyase small subunit n=1 Tax=Mycolicibacter heraklionensis TaxID=512402 RepID=A0A9X7WJ72_9MYCO|nr:ethanolamine ammonia-lyase subunit EutC [Mycolicibacter heraklionensis]QZA09266.1 ethanolamine ammonia-lyase subunit EutC [Mycolicibacter heraklionensis]